MRIRRLAVSQRCRLQLRKVFVSFVFPAGQAQVRPASQAGGVGREGVKGAGDFACRFPPKPPAITLFLPRAPGCGSFWHRWAWGGHSGRWSLGGGEWVHVVRARWRGLFSTFCTVLFKRLPQYETIFLKKMPSCASLSTVRRHILGCALSICGDRPFFSPLLRGCTLVPDGHWSSI